MPEEELDAALEDLLGRSPRPPCRILLGPEAGLYMLRGRMGQSGALFNLGELLVTRCAVECLGLVGQAWIAGNRPERARKAATLEALGQDGAYLARLMPRIMAFQARRQESQDERDREIQKTRVRFFSLARGEDD
jgi:alpha-D-ribose 1-methylphosphonate 5-triphosphate synthase subunit PhnG